MRIPLGFLVTALAQKLNIAPAIAQLLLCCVMFVGHVIFSPDGLRTFTVLAWIGLSAVVVIISSLIKGPDWWTKPRL